MSRVTTGGRLPLLGLLGGVALIVAVTGMASFTGGSSTPEQSQDVDGDGERADGDPVTATATVERRDLVEREELDGTLGYGEARQLSLGGQGTVTALAAEGSVVERGGTLGEVDGEP